MRIIELPIRKSETTYRLTYMKCEIGNIIWHTNTKLHSTTLTYRRTLRGYAPLSHTTEVVSDR